MKAFDWCKAEQMHGPEMMDLLKKTHNSNISEESFVKLFVSVPIKNGGSKRGRRAPSVGRNVYKNLRDKFGFFKP